MTFSPKWTSEPTIFSADVTRARKSGDSDTIAAQRAVLVSQLTDLLQEATRFATEFIVLLGQYRLNRFALFVRVGDGVFVIVYFGGKAHRLSEHFVESQFNVLVECEIVLIVDDRGFNDDIGNDVIVSFIVSVHHRCGVVIERIGIDEFVCFGVVAVEAFGEILFVENLILI